MSELDALFNDDFDKEEIWELDDLEGGEFDEDEFDDFDDSGEVALELSGAVEVKRLDISDVMSFLKLLIRHGAAVEIEISMSHHN